MKVLAAGAIAVFVSAAAFAQHTPDEQANAAQVAEFYENREALAPALAEDVVWNEAENFPYSDRNPYIGPDAVMEGVFSRLASEWAYFEARPRTILPSGDQVVVLGRYQGEHGGTGREIDAQFVHVWTIEDGAVTAFQQYVDTAQVQAAVGGN